MRREKIPVRRQKRLTNKNGLKICGILESVPIFAAVDFHIFDLDLLCEVNDLFFVARRFLSFFISVSFFLTFFFNFGFGVLRGAVQFGVADLSAVRHSLPFDLTDDSTHEMIKQC